MRHESCYDGNEGQTVDFLARYFSLRYEHREEFYRRAPDDWKVQIDFELRRISDLRKAIANDKMYSRLMSRLESAREVFTKDRESAREAFFTKARAALGTDTGPPRARNQNAGLQQEEEKMPSSSLNPQASLFLFKDGFPCAGRNPTKIPLYEYLDGEENTIFEQKCPEGHIRWMHLPANNMNWVEKVVSRYYREDGSKFNRYVQHSSAPRKQAESLLHHEGWYGNVQGSPGFYRYMRPRCFNVAPAKLSNPDPMETASKFGNASRVLDSETIQDKLSKQNIALYEKMPYLHWEYSSQRDFVMKILNDSVKGPSQSSRSVFNLQYISGLSDKNSKNFRHIDPSKKHISSHPLAVLLLRIATLSKVMDRYVEELVLKEEISLNSEIQLRRTLNQSNRWANSLLNDENHIIRRGTKGSGGDDKILVVDQLWMWVLDDNTVITSFPARFGARRPDPSDVHQSLCQRLAKLTKGEITSAYALSIAVIDQCTKVFFDRLRLQDERPEILDIYGSSLSYLATLRTIAFENFWRKTELRKVGVEGVLSRIHNFDLNPEGTLLREAQDIGDELQIVAGHLKTQFQVIEEFLALFAERVSHSLILRDMDTTEQIKRLEQLLKRTTSRQGDIEELIQGATAIHKSLVDLLDLRQKQALIADMPRQQFIAGLQADRADEQGRVLMLFTVVTIIFVRPSSPALVSYRKVSLTEAAAQLPLSFCASIFGMNAKEFTDHPLTLRVEFTYIITISVGMSLTILVIAFNRNLLRAIRRVIRMAGLN